MKKIVDGKRYDTDNATRLARWWNKLDRSDFQMLAESLYKTRAGAYFLVGEGGACTEYAEDVGNLTCNGERLIPMSPEEAMEWLELREKDDVIEREFPDKIVDA